MTRPSSEHTADLVTARDTVIGAYAKLLRSIESSMAEETKAVDERVAATKRLHQRTRALVGTRVAAQLSAQASQIQGLCAKSVSAGQNPLDVAEYLEIGQLTIDGRSLGLNEVPRLPWVIPFFGHSHVSLAGDRARTVLHAIVLGALRGTATGQIDVSVFDPLLRGWLAAFSPIQEVAGESLSVVATPEGLTTLRDRLVQQIQRVSQLIQGRPLTLVDYCREAGHPIERYQLFVLADYPRGVTKEMHQSLLTVARAGLAAGIVLVVVASEAPSATERQMIADFDVVSNVVSSGPLRWVTHRNTLVEVDERAAEVVSAEAAALAAQMAAASAPNVDFDQIVDAGSAWTHNSADGVTFTLGRLGPNLVDVTLGDERTQRHNVLVAGAVGQGKSNLLKVIIHSLAHRYSPDELSLYLLDFKDGVSFYPLAETPDSPEYLPHARVLGLEADQEFGLAALRELAAERNRRAKLFKPYGDNIARYRAQVGHAVMPRIVVVIDEFQRLFESSDDALTSKIAELLESTARLGRAYGIHLILASQTIAGVAALLTRENGLFAQFPIRIALKNSPSESMATLAPDNDAAAKLRYRGEAILNEDYGARSGNRQVTVASANDRTLAKIREGWWRQRLPHHRAPIVFDGARVMRLRDYTLALAALARRDGFAPVALLGQTIGVHDDRAAVVLSPEAGRNVALLGAGSDPHAAMADDDQSDANHAIGILHLAGVSLAVTGGNAPVRVLCLDLLDERTRLRSGQDNWYRLMNQLGCELVVKRAHDIVTCLESLAADVAAGTVDRPTFVIGFGLDRANLESADMFASSPADHFRTILRHGPARGVHVIGWWTNAATFSSHVGIGGDRYVDAMVFLRLDRSSVQGFLGPFVNWTVRDNRALWYDRTQLPEPVTIVPCAPTEDLDVDAMNALVGRP
ncbi:FtsK/SpoIIIE domain-containing protein [Smaragdicoccus niigatensis]|uniref:FtsK/SpoIIIE domain-containing protein n=1 Tax=Smaragdicoccus niigatensis TaxID=359359 RepID=UPI00037CD7E9|nr:FtsK/SpoIIIE domain-containing protein [Smaragdicoccus niigatensis]